MAITYYLIDAGQMQVAQAYAPTSGLPSQLFACLVSPRADKAIVRAEWTDESWLRENGVCLGELQPDGSAPQAVFDEMAKEEWQIED